MNCGDILCQLGLSNRKDVLQWLRANHPDKKKGGDEIDHYLFSLVKSCMDKKEFCKKHADHSLVDYSASHFNTDDLFDNDDDVKVANNPNVPVLKKVREKKMTILRQIENWSKIISTQRFDKQSKFNPEEIREKLHIYSPKASQLLDMIEKLDENDMKTHGKRFKHFIFSDVKTQGYGAKILAAAFMTRGYDNALTGRGGRVGLKEIENTTTNNTFAILSSTALYNSPVNEKLKKKILSRYNERPDNIHGKNIRFIIFDSGFKEGIDLFDVKYVHLYEQPLTDADLKQAVGRATRTCGQKGLNFEPNVGWPLYVYTYFHTLPKPLIDSYETVPDTHTTLHDLIMDHSELDRRAISLGKQLNKLAHYLSVDYELTKNVHKSKIDTQGVPMKLIENAPNALASSMSGGARRRKTQKRVARKRGARFNNIFTVKCHGKCGKRSTTDIPVSIALLRDVYKNTHYGRTHPVPRNTKREYFCRIMRIEPEYCAAVQREWSNRFALVPMAQNDAIVRKSMRETPDLENRIVIIGNESQSIEPELRMLRYSGAGDIVPKTLSNRMAQQSSRKSRQGPGRFTIKSSSQPRSGTYKPFKLPKTQLGFKAMRRHIYKYFRSLKWAKQKLENKCIDNTKPDDENSLSRKEKQLKRVITFNNTQEFVRKFFTPESPLKGMLWWHSVGTGKTCSAVATLSSTFERENYSIIWVTRTTLKEDVWKNIFGMICHDVIRDEIKDGKLLPDNVNKRKRELMKNWIQPLSYKQFTNLLEGKNSFYNTLVERNGRTDILKKTVIVIDEAHKLFGDDLKAVERPDMKVMKSLLRTSYRVSGKDSAKLILMTATPFTNSPMELFKLINLLREKKRDELPTKMDVFSREYLDDNGKFTSSGVMKLANQLSGYISYLNRSKDATQFAQPIMVNVPVLMSHFSPEERLLVKKPTKESREQQKIQTRELNSNLKLLKKNIADERKELAQNKKKLAQELKEFRKSLVGKPRAEKQTELQKQKDIYERKLENTKIASEKEINRFQQQLSKVASEKQELISLNKQRKAASKALLNSKNQELQLIDKGILK